MKTRDLANLLSLQPNKNLTDFAKGAIFAASTKSEALTKYFVKVAHSLGLDVKKEYATFSGGHPRCCSRKHFEDWSAAKRPGDGDRAGFCVDCTPEFQSQQIEKGTCENPEIRFLIDEDGFIDGYLPKKCHVRNDDVQISQRAPE